MKARPRRIVLAMTGASGAPYAVRLLQVLMRTDVEVHLTISPSGAAVIRQELGLVVDLRQPNLNVLLQYRPAWATQPAAAKLKTAAGAAASSHGKSHASTSSDPGDGDRLGHLPESDDSNPLGDRLHYHQYDDYMTPIASGSFQTDAMVVCPCSGSTLSGISRAAASNLVQRAAEVHLKEHRKLVIVPRETPLSVLQLENMHRLAQAGVVVLPAAPGWYHGVDSLDSIVDFVVSRILDQIGVDNEMVSRWGEET